MILGRAQLFDSSVRRFHSTEMPKSRSNRKETKAEKFEISRITLSAPPSDTVEADGSRAESVAKSLPMARSGCAEGPCKGHLS